MKMARRKMVSILMAAVMLVSAGVVSVPVAAAGTGGIIEITPFASDVVVSWTPYLTKTAYGADIELKNYYSGTITVELQNSSGTKITSFTQSFTNKNYLSPFTSRTNASGTYKVVITITINGEKTTRVATKTI